MSVDFYRHQLGEDEATEWKKVIGTTFLTLGPQVAAFEQALGQYLMRGRETETSPAVIGTNSCSMGLLLALRAFDVGEGDEVITTPMTFASTTNAILLAGATPIFVDVEPATGLIDPNLVEAAITPKTRAIMPVHLYGQLADMRSLSSIAERHRLRVVEDSAHGIEIERDGIRPGQLGDAAVFSFYATKNLTSGDGGAIATRHKEAAERLRRLRNHGVSKSASDRHGGTYQHWDLVELGYKANLTDLDAALLRIQLPKAEAKRDARESIATRYESELLERIPALGESSQLGVSGLVSRSGKSSHHLFTIRPKSDKRDALLSYLGKRGIGTAVNYRAIHLLTYLQDRLRIPRGTLPIAEEIGDRTISIPMFPTLSESAQIEVITAVAAGWNAS